MPSDRSWEVLGPPKTCTKFSSPGTTPQSNNKINKRNWKVWWKRLGRCSRKSMFLWLSPHGKSSSGKKLRQERSRRIWTPTPMKSTKKASKGKYWWRWSSKRRRRATKPEHRNSSQFSKHGNSTSKKTRCSRSTSAKPSRNQRRIKTIAWWASRMQINNKWLMNNRSETCWLPLRSRRRKLNWAQFWRAIRVRSKIYFSHFMIKVCYNHWCSRKTTTSSIPGRTWWTPNSVSRISKPLRQKSELHGRRAP